VAVRAPEPDPEREEEYRAAPAEPAMVTVLALAAVLLVLLLANGRPAVAQAPPIPAFLRDALPLDETGLALAGKAVASLFASLAGGVLFKILARRWTEDMAVAAAGALVLGTPVWAASQSLWPQTAGVLCVTVALLFIVRADYDPVWAGRTGLPLGLAVAVNPIDAALAGVLALGVALRWPRRIPWLVLFGAVPVAAGLAVHAPPFGLTEPFGPGAAGLLASPGKGILFFAPVALVGLVGAALAFRYGEHWIAGSFVLAAAAHAVLAGSAADWAAGDAYGPRLLADAMPLVIFFVPDGLLRLRVLGQALVVLSIAVQALGAFAYDDRWVRLQQSPPAPDHAELWDLEHGPVALYARRRAVILAAPGPVDGRIAIRMHPIVLFSPEGSRVEFAGEEAHVAGADATLGDVYLLGGARAEGGRLHLRGPEDGLFLRVAGGARHRPLELRIAGRGRGAVQIAEGGFWNPSPRIRSYPVAGSFVVRHPYLYAESGGPDIRITAAAGATVEIESVVLAKGNPSP
jgi:hypothetical protein